MTIHQQRRNKRRCWKYTAGPCILRLDFLASAANSFVSVRLVRLRFVRMYLHVKLKSERASREAEMPTRGQNSVLGRELVGGRGNWVQHGHNPTSTVIQCGQKVTASLLDADL